MHTDVLNNTSRKTQFMNSMQKDSPSLEFARISAAIAYMHQIAVNIRLVIQMPKIYIGIVIGD